MATDWVYNFISWIPESSVKINLSSVYLHKEGSGSCSSVIRCHVLKNSLDVMVITFF